MQPNLGFSRISWSKVACMVYINFRLSEFNSFVTVYLGNAGLSNYALVERTRVEYHSIYLKLLFECA